MKSGKNDIVLQKNIVYAPELELLVVQVFTHYLRIKEAAADGVKCHSKRYLGSILFNSGLTCISAGIPLLTNASKVVKYLKACHSVCAAVWRGSHNIAELPLISYYS